MSESLRSGVRNFFDKISTYELTEENMAVTGEAESKAEALELFNKETPDLALVDISLKNSNGLDLIKHLTKLYPDTILIL